MPRTKHSIPKTFPVAAGILGKSFFVLGLRESTKGLELVSMTSSNGLTFSRRPQKILLKTSTGKNESLEKCSDFKIFSGDKEIVLSYVKVVSARRTLVYATGKSLSRLTVRGQVSAGEAGVVVSEQEKGAGLVAYFGRDVVKAATSKKGTRWNTAHESARPHWRFFDGLPFQLAGAVPTASGIALIAGASMTEDILEDVNRGRKVGEVRICRLGIAMYRSDQPAEMIWHTELPFMDRAVGEPEEDFTLLGVVPFLKKKEKLVRVYFLQNGKVRCFEFPQDALENRNAYVPLLLTRFAGNPIIGPSNEAWEKHAAFNPTALKIDHNVHLLYRAIGLDGVSRLGYALSKNGKEVNERLSYPVFIPQRPGSGTNANRHYDPVAYPSGGSWGGSEDPRMVSIDGKVYVTFNMFDSWAHLRVAVVWISVEDFLAKRFWKWSKPIMLSPEGQVHKNWILFPEKINGKFAFIHNLHGDSPRRICVEYTDSIEEYSLPPGFKSSDPNAIADRPTAWHKRMRSGGPPPLKTDKGWLLFYHATDRHEPHRYKLGVMLLDLHDPSKVLYRSRAAVLRPDVAYENNGKPGIVYACGAVEIDGVLHIYYGGADKVACVATIRTKDLLDHIMTGRDARFGLRNVSLA